MTRRSPLKPTLKYCPRCLKPLQRGSKFGGWLIPQDYYCSSCGYRGTLFLEKNTEAAGGGEKTGIGDTNDTRE